MNLGNDTPVRLLFQRPGEIPPIGLLVIESAESCASIFRLGREVTSLGSFAQDNIDFEALCREGTQLNHER